MQMHLSLDALLGTAPLLFLKEDKTVTASLISIGLFELTVALATETILGCLSNQMAIKNL